MSARSLEQERLACSPMGSLEYVVESQHDGRIEKWFVLRPHPHLASNYEEKGVPLPHGCRVVVEAHSLRPVGVLGGRRLRRRRRRWVTIPISICPPAEPVGRSMRFNPQEISGSRVRLRYSVELHYESPRRPNSCSTFMRQRRRANV